MHPARSASDPVAKRQQVATRAIFGIGGTIMGSWAPLVPLAKFRLGIDEATLGALLLCMGAGSVLAMPLTAWLTSRSGCRQIIGTSATLLLAVVPLLTVAPSAGAMALGLLAFGMTMGCTSVAMNLQAVIVEKQSGRSMMSGFHALFSLGGIFGSAVMTGLLALNLPATLASLAISGAMAVLLWSARPCLLGPGEAGEPGPAFVAPKGIVILLGILALMAMMAEGAVLDWGALFLIQVSGTQAAAAGLGYTAFALSMTAGRLSGDLIRNRFGDTAVLFWSAAIAAFGFLLALAMPTPLVGLASFLLVGAGLSNLIPILFTFTGRTTAMPTHLALSSVFTVAYVGIIGGPAVIGIVAHAFSLQTAFWMLFAATTVTALSARAVAGRL